MHADYFVRQGARITITESTTEGAAYLEMFNSVLVGDVAESATRQYASESTRLFLTLNQLDQICATIQQFQQERANLHSPDLEEDERVYNAAYDAARAQDEASAEPHNASERHIMADVLATASVNARREEQRKARATITANFGK